jgi:hypothetical protein
VIPWLPDAERQIMATAGPFTGGPAKGVLHTTESNGWPDYRGGTVAPHVTVRLDVAARRLLVRQHIPFDRAAKSLRNDPDGVQTNRDSAIQLELVGTCDPSFIGAYYWPRADDYALAALARLMRVIEAMTGIRRRAAGSWPSYPFAYGADAPQRFTLPQWDAWDGWCGHMHVPENTHGDPGSLNMSRLIGSPGPKRPPRHKTVDKHAPAYPLAHDQAFNASSTNGFGSARERASIRAIQTQLVRHGYAATVDGLYGSQTQRAVTDFQRRYALTADGLVGPRTWSALWQPKG